MSEERSGAGVVTLPTGSSMASPFQVVDSAHGARQRFYVELKEETTVISWKRLLRSVASIVPEAPPGAKPALEARLAPLETGTGVAACKDQLPPPNRFSSVIEKIERLYKGDDSEDENLDDVPDEDQYNTDDSFIDDSELNEYFSVDKSKTKHTGFFINKGKLEKISEPTPPPVAIVKKRKRRETKVGGEDGPKKVSKVNIGHDGSASRLKAAARKADSLTLVAAPKEKKDYGSFKPLLHDKGSSQCTVENGSEREDTLAQEMQRIKDSYQAKIKASPKRSGAGSAAYKGFQVGGLDSSEERNIGRKLEAAIDLPSKDNTAGYVNKVKREEIKEVEGTGSRGGSTAFRSPGGRRDASPVKRASCVKTNVLERAIQDLAKEVIELCPPSSDAQELDQSQLAKSKRLPRDVKQKLAKVARLAQARQGKIPDELVERLMGILGHVMRLKTLKRNLKEMVELGLSAKQEKEGRLEDIKRQVTEMVRSRVSTLQSQDAENREGSADDFQTSPNCSEKRSNDRFKWDQATEDRLCDLYEEYLQGIDEHKGPQIRKLYLELAELWPEGWMDNNGVKNAVHRAKERKKKLDKLNRMGARKKLRLAAKNGENSRQLEENMSRPSNVILQGYTSSSEKPKASGLISDAEKAMLAKQSGKDKPIWVEQRKSYARGKIETNKERVRKETVMLEHDKGLALLKKRLKTRDIIDQNEYLAIKGQEMDECAWGGPPSNLHILPKEDPILQRKDSTQPMRRSLDSSDLGDWQEQ